MNKNLLKILCLTLPFIAHADNAQLTEPFPSSTRGIQIVSASKMNFPTELKQKLLNANASYEKNGYVETSQKDRYVNHLLSINQSGPNEIKEFKNNNPYDTHLKANLYDIKLSNSFKPLKAIKKENVIGYAAVGTYVKEEGSTEGWNGIKIYFNDVFLGICAYTKYPIMAAQLNKETIKHFINKKPSNQMVQGNYNTGFLYSLSWYTNNSVSTVECANKKFDKQISKGMISLAKKIDKETE